MDESRIERLKEALLLVESLSVERRRAWMESRLGDDKELLAEALSLLDAGSESQLSLEPLVKTESSMRLGPLPERIGPYVVESLIGQGGMSLVYRARQETPVKRHVAVKVLRPQALGPGMLARFEAEGQAIARLEHHNIARLLEAGKDYVGGRVGPYIAMELVDGPPITEYCRLHHSDLNERLGLLVQVCRGVQHAHDRGILHRDLKPSNILVLEEDGRPVPKVIDFGVARILGDDVTKRQTVGGQVLGTAEYMSPEQADPLRPDADVRSDVYSLGVVLYELITGSLPFDDYRAGEASGMGRSPAELREHLQSRVAVAPGRRLAELGASGYAWGGEKKTASGKTRRPTQQLVTGELDSITLKALHADRQQRYESAGALADDVERFMRGEVVRARPPTRRYVWGKMMWRHRVMLAASAAVLLAVVLGLVGTTLALRRALEEKARAVAALNDSERSRKEAQDLRAKAEEALQAAEEARKAGEITLKDAEDVAMYLRRVWKRARPEQLGPAGTIKDAAVAEAKDVLATPPASAMVRARVNLALCDPLIMYHEYALAEQLLVAAVEGLKAEKTRRGVELFYTARMRLADTKLAMLKTAEALAIYDETDAEFGAVMTADELLRLRLKRADVFMVNGESAKALAVREDAVGKGRESGASPEYLEWGEAALVRGYLATGQYDKAVAAGNPFWERRVGKAIDRSDTRAASTIVDYGNALIRAGELKRAREVLTRSVAECEMLYGADHAMAFRARQLMIQVRAKSGEKGVTADMLGEIEQAKKRGVEKVMMASWQPMLIEVCLTEGQTEVARAEAAKAMEWVRAGEFEMPQRYGIAMGVVTALMRYGQMELAEIYLKELGPLIKRDMPDSRYAKMVDEGMAYIAKSVGGRGRDQSGGS